MSNYDPNDRERGGSHRYRDDRRDDRDARYVETQESTYARGYPSSSHDLVPARRREDSDLMSVEEIRRDFPPPGYAPSREIRRREDYYDDYADRGHHSSSSRAIDRHYDDGEHDRRPSKKKGGAVYYEEEEKTRKRVLSQQQKIFAAIAGAALPVIAKEIYDRREAKEEGSDVHRNLLTTAALAAAGGAAAYGGAELYNRHTSKEEKTSHYVAYKGRDGRVGEYYSDESEDDEKSKKGSKNFLESALAAAGIGGLVKSLSGGGSHLDDGRSDTRSQRGRHDRSRSKSGGEAAARIQKAAMSSLLAGATEAFRIRKDPGTWQGEKIKRVITAATAAGGIGSAQDPDRHSKRHLVESVIGGLISNRMVNGSRKDIEEDKRTGRSRSRSRARSDGGGGGGIGIPALLTAGLGALGAKKLVDAHNRDRSQSRGRGRSPDSNDSRDASPKRHRSRSRSVVDSMRKGLAKMGIGSAPEEDRRRDHDDDDNSPRRSSRRPHDDYDDGGNYSRGGGRSRGVRDDDDYGDDQGDDRRSHKSGGTRGRDSARSAGGSGRHRSASGGSSTDLGDSEEDEKRAKKMRDPRRRH